MFEILEFFENVDMTFIWLVLLVVFVIAEAVTVNLISIWFALGSLAAMVAAVFGAELWLQVTLFIATAAVTLLLTRPFVKKYILPKHTPTNTDRIIGISAAVSEDIDNSAEKGAIFADGKEWSARSSEGNEIPKGTLVTVDKIEGVKVFVSVIKSEK